jgi:hypothetical protein
LGDDWEYDEAPCHPQEDVEALASSCGAPKSMKAASDVPLGGEGARDSPTRPEPQGRDFGLAFGEEGKAGDRVLVRRSGGVCGDDDSVGQRQFPSEASLDFQCDREAAGVELRTREGPR